MKEFDFEEFQKAWDAQEKVFEKMNLVNQNEVKKMMQNASNEEIKRNNQLLQNAQRKKWIWRGAVAACIITVLVTTIITLTKIDPISKSQIGISQDIISQTNDKLQNSDLSGNEDIQQTKLHSLSTTEANRHEDESIYGNLSATETGRQESEVKTQYPAVSMESDVVPYGTTSEAYQMKPADNVDNYGHEATVMSNRKCNVNQIVHNLHKIL